MVGTTLWRSRFGYEIGDGAIMEANNQVAAKDGSSDTSTVGAADDDVGDWEERL